MAEDTTTTRRHGSQPHDKGDDDTKAPPQPYGDEYKIFVSRIPVSFDEGSVQRVLEDALGVGTVLHVALAYTTTAKEDENETPPTEPRNTPQTSNDSDNRFDRPHKKKPKIAVAASARPNDENQQQHRGYGFVTLQSVVLVQHAVTQLQMVQGVRAKPASRKKHTLYIGPCLTDEQKKESSKNNNNVCFLWTARRCPYGDTCKFAHTGPGSGLDTTTTTTPSTAVAATVKSKQKCREYRKKGQCQTGDACPFSHDFVVPTAAAATVLVPRPDADKDCIDWKTKGQCRKLSKHLPCPYKHDPEKQKKKKRPQPNDATTTTTTKNTTTHKQKQPLQVRVFGLNYDTTEDSIRRLFADCGPIQNVDYPAFSDSGRGKGYCGITFSSPKAVAAAIQTLDGSHLDGRWISVQAGKMYLEDWEKHHADRQQQQQQQAGGGTASSSQEPKRKKTREK